MSTFSSNTTLKVNRAISGADTVNANCYAVVTYVSSVVATVGGGAGISASIIAYFGPGQTIPATYTINDRGGIPANYPVYSIVGGVEFINTP